MKYKLTIECDKNELLTVRKFVADQLEAHQVPDLEAHKLVLAVDEVCANLIIHSNDCNPDKRITVEIQFSNKQIIFQFIDKGNSFNINEYQAPSMDEIVSTRRKGGLGLILVKRIMDKIEFSYENNYNICTLTKNFPI